MNQQKTKICEICETNATIICLNCSNYYCDSCFKLIHEKKAKSNHKKEAIDYFIPIDIKCPDHPGNLMNLFCIDEKGK